MNVKELRDGLVAFDDDVEVRTAPEVGSVRVADDTRATTVPHPLFERTITGLHVVGDMNPLTLEAGNRRIVLSYEQETTSAMRPPADDSCLSPIVLFYGRHQEMTWECFRSFAPNVVTVRLSGVFSIPGLTEILERLAINGCLHYGQCVLFDDRNVDLTQLTEKDVFQAAEILAQHAEILLGNRIGLLFDTPHGFRLGCRLEYITQDRGDVCVQAFLDEEEALSWATS